MTKSLTKSNERGHAWAYCGIAGVVLVLFAPSLFHGWIPFFMDTVTQFYPARFHAAELLGRGEAPFWNRSYYLGTPLLANPQWGLLHPFHWPFLLWPVGALYMAVWPLHILIAAWGTYQLTWALVRRRSAALVAAALTVGNSWTWAHLAFGAYLDVTAWIPWVVWGMIRFLQTGRPIWFIACAVFWAFQLLAGAPQIAWYSALNYGLLGLLFVFPFAAPSREGEGAPDSSRLTALTAGRWGPLWATLLFGGLGVCLAAPQLIPTVRFLSLCDRAQGLAWPEVECGTLPFWYFWKVFTGGTFDEGTGIFFENAEKTCFFSVAGLLFVGASLLRIHRPGPLRALWIALVINLLFCNHTMGAVLYRLFPLYKSFHDPQRILSVVQVWMAVLGGIGLWTAMDGLWNRIYTHRTPQGVSLRSTRWGGGGVFVGAVVLAGALFAATVWNGGRAPESVESFVGWGPVGVVFSVCIALSALGFLSGAMLIVLGRRRDLSVDGVVLCFGLGIALGALAFSVRHVDTKVIAPSRLETPVARRLKEVLGPSSNPRYLTLDLTGGYSGAYERPAFPHLLLPNLSGLHGLEDVQGYDPFIPRKYSQWLATVNGVPNRSRHFGLISWQAALLTEPAPWGAIVTQSDFPDRVLVEMGFRPKGDILPMGDSATTEATEFVLVRPPSVVPYAQILNVSGRPLTPAPVIEWSRSANGFQAVVSPLTAESRLQVYDSALEGWIARVDGEAVELVDAPLLQIPLMPSEKSQLVELNYYPPGLNEGLGGLAIGVLLLIVLCVRRRPTRTTDEAA